MRSHDDLLICFLRGFLGTLLFYDIVLGGIVLCIKAIEWWRG